MINANIGNVCVFILLVYCIYLFWLSRNYVSNVLRKYVLFIQYYVKKKMKHFCEIDSHQI